MITGDHSDWHNRMENIMRESNKKPYFKRFLAVLLLLVFTFVSIPGNWVYSVAQTKTAKAAIPVHSKNTALLESIDGIDISIGGGNDIAGRPEIINHTWLINPGKHAEALNQINLNIYKGKLIGVLYSQIFLTEAYEEDESINKIIAQYQTKVDAGMAKVVG